MDELAVSLALKIFQRPAQGEIFAIVYFSSSDHVTDHLAGIFEGHEAFITALIVAIDPVFPMMFITAFVVKPGFAETVDFPADCKGRTVAVVIFYTFPKFCGREFA